ncbi:MAG TPA: hypothetical protein VHU22_09040 [Xanthobacteraceae bacterium]|jgi:hypothetical protein|nr:hypothetical protein [Xanthobacteraceae bacterium]
MFRSGTKRTNRAVSIAVLLASLLAGCSDLYFDRRETIAFGGGDSVAANAAEQTVDPWPRNSNNNHLTFNGQRMQRAVECYRYNKVTPPADIDPSIEGASLIPPPQPATCDSALSAASSSNNNQWNNGPGGGAAGVLGSALSGTSSSASR